MRQPWTFIITAALTSVSFCQASFCQAAKRAARTIKIQSGWGGLGIPQKADIIIQRSGDTYVRNGEPIEASSVDAFIEALQAPPVPKPSMDNLGITPRWLVANRLIAEASLDHLGSGNQITSGQKTLLSESFVDQKIMAQVTSDLFTYMSSDDYPHVQAKVTFDDGSQITATTNSYYVFMIPWDVSGLGVTMNADISRTFSALLPPAAPNKTRLVAQDLVPKLAEGLVRQIEPQLRLRGVEDRLGSSFNSLRGSYTVKAADINSYHDVAFGRRWIENKPSEMNLQAFLHKESFPSNMNEHLVLRYEGGKLEGLDGFLKDGAKYELLALSVPWLKQFLLDHPNEYMTLEFVQQESFGDHAMESFAADMTARGRADLIPAVKADQQGIALLHINYAYWLLFPDKHMMLWRFEGPSGFLKWAPSDFLAGSCDKYYRVNNGGCSGREITSDGELLPDR